MAKKLKNISTFDLIVTAVLAAGLIFLVLTAYWAGCPPIVEKVEAVEEGINSFLKFFFGEE